MFQDTAGDRSAHIDSYRERLTNFSNEFDLGLFLYIVKRSTPWLLLCILLAAATAWTYLRYTPPTYASSTLMQLGQSNRAKTVLQVSDMMEDHSLQADVQLLRSKFFIAQAVAKLPLRVRYFYRGQILTDEHYRQSFFKLDSVLVTDAAVEGRPIGVHRTDDGKVQLEYTMDGTLQQVPVVPGKRFGTPHFSAVLSTNSDRPWPQDLDRNTLYFTINSNKALTDQLAGQLSVSVSDPEAGTVLIGCKAHSALLARDLCQAMADAYIQYDLQRRSESAESILRFIESQKDTVFAELRESELKIELFKRDNRVADMKELSPLLVQRSDQYEDDMLKLRMEDNLLEEVQHAAKQDQGHMDVYHLLPLLTGTSLANTLSDALKTLGELLQERERMAFEATTANETLRALDHRIERQQDLVLESIATLRDRNASLLQDYQEKMDEYESRFARIPEQELAYGRIERLFNINEKYYTQLLEKDIEYRISKAGFVPENRVLESASLSFVPVSPNRGLAYLTYLLTGLILGVLLVLVRYILHDRITSLNDIAKASNASVGILGLVPKYKKEIPVSQLLVDENPKSLIAESFRNIRTNLQFVDPSGKPMMIAVTSTIAGEGKTFVSINLGGVISFSGKRVVVVDLDMRKPKIHLGFGVENTHGMSTLLIGKDSLDNCIRHSALPGLDFITAGPIPPNPSELIISPAMGELIERLREHYDTVVVDTPPVGLVTDGIPIIQAADVPIYVFRSDLSRKSFVQNVDRLINENRITKLCAVLNDVDVDRNKYGYTYGYGHGYGYGYGHGYGYYDDRTPRSAKAPWYARIFGKA
jgi:tyrosine-protein kinase Etk/Wzc